MGYELKLPKDKGQREDVLNNIIKAGEEARHPKEIGWWHAHHYLQGCRDFSNVNYETGTLDINYINEDGMLRFRYDDIVSQFQSQMGRLMRVDMRPRVQKRSVGLEDLRKASIAQIVLDAALPADEIEKLKLKLFPPLLKYGCVGLVVWNEGEDIGIDVVMPWEIIPIPARPIEDKDVRGLCRVRYVPMSWVKKLGKTPMHNADVYKEMKRVTIPISGMPSESGDRFSVYGESVTIRDSIDSKPFGSKDVRENQTRIEVVKMAEVWTETQTGHLGQYEMVVGEKLIVSDDYKDNKIAMPITKINDIRTGDFWGRGYVSTQIPLNTEMEHTLGRLFQTIQDMDAYGILCIPTTMGIPPTVNIAADGTKRLMFEPDYVNQDLKPFTLAPANLGTFPAHVMKLAVALSEKMANQPRELMRGEAPGRVDSGQALGVLMESSNTPLTPTLAGISVGMVNCYKSILDTIAAGAWPDDKLVQVSMLDDTLAGVTLDSTQGTINMAENILPRPDEVAISIRSMAPKSIEQEKFELKEALDKGHLDMFEYRVEVRKRGLELPVGNEAEWQNYRRAIMENIVLFGDGQKPGEVITSERDMHDVHLRVLQAFMARPEFFLASPKVRDVFKDHYEFHTLMLAATIPDQAPYPEDAAVEQEAQIRMQENEMI